MSKGQQLFRCLVILGTIFVGKMSQIVIISIRSYRLVLFETPILKKPEEKNAENGFLVILALSWPLHGVMCFPLRPLPRSCVISPHFFVSYKLVTAVLPNM